MKKAWRVVRVLVSFPFLAVGAALMVAGLWLHWDRRGMRQATVELFGGV